MGLPKTYRRAKTRRNYLFHQQPPVSRKPRSGPNLFLLGLVAEVRLQEAERQTEMKELEKELYEMWGGGVYKL